ncbi:MAG: phosphodiester glycosidase family protein [Bifidobacterium aquikefiri]|nr:phosphodiester glycosidase family protein [Bifidobacterium aquikefiri]
MHAMRHIAIVTTSCFLLPLLFIPSYAQAADSSSGVAQIDGWPQIASRQSTSSYDVTSGVHYSSEDVNSVQGKQPVEELDSDLSSSNVKLGVVGAGDEVVNSSDETISSMANRSGAVAGINGGYFSINASGEPTDGEIINGEIYKSPKNSYDASFGVTSDGKVTFDTQRFSGTIADGSATHALTSIGWESDAQGDGITEITPHTGAISSQYLGGTRLIVLGTSSDNGKTIHVTSITTADHVDKLPSDTYGLLASDSPSAGGKWIRTNIHQGDDVSLTSSITPNAGIQQLVEASYRIIANGKANTDSAGVSTGNTDIVPRTAIGTTEDGHLIMATFDGHQTNSNALGVTMAQVTSYMLSKGVTNAVQLDGGGSTEMVARKTGNTTVSVMNTPSDGQERPVTNGIFLYSTAPANGRSQAAHINSDKAVSTALGATVPVDVYASDSAGNATTKDQPRVTVSPASLGTWSNNEFTAKGVGTGTITARIGDAVASVSLTVTSKYDALTINPDDLDVVNGGSGTLSVIGKNGTTTTTLDAKSATWKVADPTLGSISQTGVFTGAADGSGLATVTATVGTQTATTQVAVGTAHETAATADDPSAWSLSYYGGATGDAAYTADATDTPSSQKQSIRLSYDMPSSSGVHQLVMWPKNTVTIDKNGEGVTPTSITVWAKIDDPVHSAFEVCISFIQANGQKTNEYVSNLTYGKWAPITVQIPSGSSLPVTFNFVDLLSIRPSAESKGTIHLGYVTGDYSPRPASAYAYSGIASNPEWLKFDEDSSDFKSGGTTYLMGDDAHLLASDTKSASAVNLEHIAERVAGKSYTTDSGQTVEPLSSTATPTQVQMLGDMPDDGELKDLQYAQSLVANIGLPYHDLVGNHEDTQGTLSEADNFAQVFGDTHYMYRTGKSTFIAVDNSHGGVTSSDKYQSPSLANGQYPWLQQQLESSSTPVVIVGIHMPAYDPFPAQNSEFSDRWEAQQFLQLVQNYQNAHPDKHVMIVYGHARGFSEQLLNPEGQSVTWPSGIPQFTFADLGMPAYSTPDQGGFYHFGLVHVNDDGSVEFSVEPLLSSLAIDQGTAAATAADGQSSTVKVVDSTKSDTLETGQTKQYSATGIAQQGDNGNPAISLHIADPVSHVWASSNPTIASVDAKSGLVTAHKAGTVSISITTGGITASSDLVVTAAPSNDSGHSSGSTTKPGNPAEGVPDNEAENSKTHPIVNEKGTATSQRAAKSVAKPVSKTAQSELSKTGSDVSQIAVALMVTLALGLTILKIRRIQK